MLPVFARVQSLVIDYNDLTLKLTTFEFGFTHFSQKPFKKLKLFSIPSTLIGYENSLYKVFPSCWMWRLMWKSSRNQRQSGLIQPLTMD